MMRYFESKETSLVMVLLETGDLLLESICEVARQADIHTGALVTGIGSLSKARIHTVLTNVNPVEELYLDLEGPLEVTNFNGLIANYEPHVHITMSTPQMKFYGGHLENGCEILTLSEFSIRRIPDVRLHREANPQRSPYPYRMLDLQDGQS
jgi:predicted DNA-binding protein with PD1-like motif